ncbi:MAG: PIN domain-containing protein [Mobiluncus sp.]|uniref:type II toxin-antitoxin system VapC family toxin n=1 Tax=Mobiluncus sp. TaxID=47293 RepID=UPI0025884CC1|nr:PIN domain-containing protein [Mobiluncus sp.]MCI6584951.1 PIN domain-containing protein [Mobiluncus sp.]
MATPGFSTRYSFFVDTNVVVDLLSNRQPFAAPAQELFHLFETEQATGAISALTIPNSVCILRKLVDLVQVSSIVSVLQRVVNIVELNSEILTKATSLGFSDFEDAIQTVSAMQFQADYIVTRDKRDFVKSPIPTIPPETALELIRADL